MSAERLEAAAARMEAAARSVVRAAAAARVAAVIHVDERAGDAWYRLDCGHEMHERGRGRRAVGARVICGACVVMIDGGNE